MRLRRVIRGRDGRDRHEARQVGRQLRHQPLDPVGRRHRGSRFAHLVLSRRCPSGRTFSYPPGRRRSGPLLGQASTLARCACSRSSGTARSSSRRRRSPWRSARPGSTRSSSTPASTGTTSSRRSSSTSSALAEPAHRLDLRTADVDLLTPADRARCSPPRGRTSSSSSGTRTRRSPAPGPPWQPGVALAHVEAGLRSGDLSMPEERARIEVDGLATLLLCPDERSADDAARRGRRRAGSRSSAT